MYASAAFAVVRALAVSDATAALALARAVKDSNSERPVALALAAQGLDAAAAAPVFREAMAAAQGEYWAAATMARVAAMAAQTDAKLGEELFREARERVTRPSPHGDDEMQESFAAYAFYRAPIDPAESRLLLEAEWARYGTPPNRDKSAKDNYDDYMRRQRMTQLALAMAAVDLNRALEMLKTPMGGQENDWQRQSAIRRVFSYIMATEAERRTMSLDGRGDFDH
jgi:hypothetical protein